MLSNKGISLIVLIITIVVIVILTGAIVLNILQNDPIKKANEAVIRNRIQSQQELLSMYISNQTVSHLETFDVNTFNVNFSSDPDLMRSIFGGVKDTDLQNIDVHNGKLRYIGRGLNEIEVVKNMNMGTIYDGTVGIVKPAASIIDKNQGMVEVWVNVTDSLRQELADKSIFSTYADERYTNTLVLRYTRDKSWQAIMASDYNQVSDISAVDTLAQGWHSFAIRWSSSEFSLYIDGIKVATESSPTLMQSVPSNMYIGTGPRLNLVKNGYVNLGNNSGFPGFTYTNSDYTSAIASLKVTGNAMPSVTQDIEIDTNKTYKGSGNFKSVGTGGLSNTYFGVSCLDANKQALTPNLVYHYQSTETFLTEDLKSGDTTVYVNNASSWKNSTSSSYMRYVAVYNYMNYTEYTYTRNTYAFSNSDAITNTITLTSPYSGQTILKGTKVANSYDGGTFNYFVYATPPSVSWVNYTGNITGIDLYNGSPYKFRAGTKYVRMLFLSNYSQSSSYSTLVDDIEFIDMTNTIFNTNIQQVCVSNIAREDSEILNRYNAGTLTRDGNVTYMLTD